MPEPGWYDDGRGAIRWWDGAGWTQQTAPSSPATTAVIDGVTPAMAHGPAKSRAWLLWVIGGGVLLVAAIVAAVVLLLPGPSGESAPAGASVSDAEREYVVDVIDQYGQAWESADCGSFLDATTSDFREPTALADCSLFETQAETFAAATDDYEVVVTDVREAGDGRILVATTESFTWITDESGAPLDAEVRDVLHYEYLIEADGAQRTIDEIRAVIEPAETPAASPSPSGDSVTLSEDLLAPIIAYDRGLFETDCGLFEDATTVGFRHRVGVVDCESFAAAARGRAAVMLSMYWVPISSRATGRGTMTVDAGAVMESMRDEFGQPVDAPVVLDEVHRYHLSRVGGEWRIADVQDVSEGRVEGQLLRDEEKAVTATMSKWRRSFTGADCDAAMAATTPAYREALGWTDCDAFARWHSDVKDNCESMDVHAEEMRFNSRVDGRQGSIVVDVVTVCTEETDDAGNPIEPALENGNPYRYHLVHTDGEWLIDDSSDGAAAEDEPANENERAAVAAIRSYNEAWATADCAAYTGATTAELRSLLELSDCPAFESAARDFAASWTLTGLVPTDTERTDQARMEIKVRETYGSRFDSLGQPADPPIPYEEYWVYTMELSNGEWVVSDTVKLL